MQKYPIKRQNVDFKIIENSPSSKGSRVKKLVIDNNNEKAFFKRIKVKKILNKCKS